MDITSRQGSMDSSETDANAKELIKKAAQVMEWTADQINLCFRNKLNLDQVIAVFEKCRQQNELMMILMQKFLSFHPMTTPVASHYSSLMSSGGLGDNSQQFEVHYFSENREAFEEMIQKLQETIKMLETSKRKIHLKQMERRPTRVQRKDTVPSEEAAHNEQRFETELQNLILCQKEPKKQKEDINRRRHYHSEMPDKMEELKKRKEVRIQKGFFERFFTFCS